MRLAAEAADTGDMSTHFQQVAPALVAAAAEFRVRAVGAWGPS